MKLKPFKMTGTNAAFVAIKDGKEIGTIVKIERDSAWQVHLGIGRTARHLGNVYGKREAVTVLDRAS